MGDGNEITIYQFGPFILEVTIRRLQRDGQTIPLSSHVHTSHGVLSYFARQYDSGITWCQESLELDPSFYPAYAVPGLAYLQKGMYEEAITALETAFNMSDDPEALSMLGYAYAIVGQKEEARQIIRRLEDWSHQRYIKPYYLAIIYVGLEERDYAFRWLEKALADRNDLTILIRIDPRFDDLRDDPRLISLLRKMAFPVS